MSEDSTRAVLTALCDCIEKTRDKQTCTRTMWCLARQDCDKKVVESEVITHTGKEEE